MISNPATWFIDNSNMRSFTYEGGAKLFHWSPYDSYLSQSMESNVIFFADDVDHARDVLRRLFEFWIDCNERYMESQQDTAMRGAETSTLRNYLTVMDQMTISEAPINQFYEVGWADNDDLSV